MEEKRVQAGEYEVVIRFKDDLIEITVFDALGEEIEGIRIADSNEDDIDINLN